MNQPRIHVALIDQPIDITALLERVGDPDVGAHGWFLGVTRRTTDDRVTDRLSYQAHRPMAIRELEKLAETALEKFSLCKIVLVHRLGEVPVGEASVVVGCSSGHRPQTFEALAWVMDTLKREIPIWKQESYTDGTTEWVHPTDSSSDEGKT